MYGENGFLAHTVVPSLRCFVQVVHCMVKTGSSHTHCGSFITLLCSGGALYGENGFLAHTVVPSLRCFVQVVTTKGSFTCSKLVVTAGAWLNDVLGSIGVHLPVTVTQEQVTYLATPHMKDFTKDKSVAAVYLPSPPLAPFFFSSCLLYTSPSPRDKPRSRMPSSA